MIKEILKVFKGESLMQRAFDRSYEMLELTRTMFHESKEVLRKTDKKLEELNIYKNDHSVNKYEREVRKDVFNHLVMSGTENLASGLVLVSVIIDIERIGDFTKNIVEIAGEHGEMLKAGEYENDLKELENTVEEYFDKAIVCFKNSDEELGVDLLQEYGWVTKKCDEMIRSMLQKEDIGMKSNSVVALTLYIRSLKRIFGHLRNLVSSIVNPFHRIGFKYKKKK